MAATNILTIPRILALYREQLGTPLTSTQQRNLDRLPLVLNYLVGIGKANAGVDSVHLETAWRSQRITMEDFMILHGVQVPTGTDASSDARRPLLTLFAPQPGTPRATMELSVGFRRASSTEGRAAA